MAAKRPGWPAVPALPLTQAQRAQLWALMTAAFSASAIWQAMANQVPSNYITPYGSPGQYLAAPSWSSMSDNDPQKARVYAYDQALQNTYSTLYKGGTPASAPPTPPGGTGPGQGGDIGGANPGFGVSTPWWLDFKRIAMFAGGAILMGVAINAALRSQMGRGAPQLPGPKAIVKTAKKVAK